MNKMYKWQIEDKTKYQGQNTIFDHLCPYECSYVLNFRDSVTDGESRKKDSPFSSEALRTKLHFEKYVDMT